jgi:hypothetical protein
MDAILSIVFRLLFWEKVFWGHIQQICCGHTRKTRTNFCFLIAFHHLLFDKRRFKIDFRLYKHMRTCQVSKVSFFVWRYTHKVYFYLLTIFWVFRSFTRRTKKKFTHTHTLQFFSFFLHLSLSFCSFTRGKQHFKSCNTIVERLEKLGWSITRRKGFRASELNICSTYKKANVEFVLYVYVRRASTRNISFSFFLF